MSFIDSNMQQNLPYLSTVAMSSFKIVGGLPLATCTGDFPYLVIEYFRQNSLSQTISDKKLRIEGQLEIAGKIKEVYSEATDSFLVEQIKISGSDNRVYKERWKLIEMIVVVEPSLFQTYFSKSLNHAHYSVHPLEYQSYCQHLRQFQKTNKEHPTLYFCSKQQDHDIPGLIYVRNKVNGDLQKALFAFPLTDMVVAVKKHGKQDEKRGNYKLDTGLASGLCQKRLPEWFGIAGPNHLLHTKLEVCKVVRSKLYKVLPLATPSSYKGKLYYCHRTASLFGYKLYKDSEDGVHIHSFRMALSWKSSELAIHRDVHNDNANMVFSPVVVASWMVRFEKKVMRVAVITYSRKFVADTIAKIDRYGPAINHITGFYHRMRQQRRTMLDPTLFQQAYKKEGYSMLLAARIKPHINTCLHWSAMGADAVLQLNRKYRISQEQGLALIYSVCASNSPDYFRVITDCLLKDSELGQMYFSRPSSRIVIDIYEMIFHFKADASRGKHTLPGQRHQPCANKRGSREAVCLSLQNMINSCNSIAGMDNVSWNCKQNVKKVYLSTLKTFCKSETNGGIYGAGPLVSNKIIQIGALVGLFPIQFLLQSKIAKSTCTYRYLSQQFGLDNVETDSGILLDALAFTTSTNQLLAEGMCCKAAQEYNMQQNGREIIWVDTIYYGMSILTLNMEDDGTAPLCVQEVTAKGISVVDLEDRSWKLEVNNGGTKEERWKGYWIGCLNRPVSIESRKIKRERLLTDVINRRKDCQRKKGDCSTTTIPTRKRKRNKQKVVPPVEEKYTKWIQFNYPLQSDVLVASLKCRKPYNKWSLLGQALGKCTGVNASHRDLSIHTLLENVSPGTKRWWYAAVIPLPNGTSYSPPTPQPCWDKCGYKLEGARAWFTDFDVARGYTIINFLVKEHTDLMNRWLSTLLNRYGNQFSPQRLKIATRKRDPKKMVVLWDNDRRQIEPMAVCMEITNNQGVFALVDDFGRILQDTAHRFLIIGRREPR
jgi:hypothetical protein